jgi:hypothetical protein
VETIHLALLAHLHQERATTHLVHQDLQHHGLVIIHLHLLQDQTVLQDRAALDLKVHHELAHHVLDLVPQIEMVLADQETLELVDLAVFVQVETLVLDQVVLVDQVHQVLLQELDQVVPSLEAVQAQAVAVKLVVLLVNKVASPSAVLNQRKLVARNLIIWKHLN